MGSGNGLIEVIGLAFSVVAIRLMMVVENAQVTIAGTIGQKLPKKSKKVVAMTIGAKKFLVLKMGIVFFGRISSLIFLVQEMYAEKTVQLAASTMMNTILVSNRRVGRAATRYTRHAARAVRKGVTHPYYRHRQSRGHTGTQGA